MFKIFYILSIFIFLTNCSYIVGQPTSEEDKKFNEQLAKGYESFSKAETKQYDWIDAEHFDQKAKDAANNNDVAAENPDNWDLANHKRSELEYARRKLNEVLTVDLKREEPHEAARLQISYDCWIEQQEEGWQVNHINSCREEFLSILTKYTTYNFNPSFMIYARDVPYQNYIVYFDSDLDVPNIAGQNIIKHVMAKLNESDEYYVVIQGHTDTANTKAYNLDLSIRRADNIKKYLLAENVDESKIGVEAYGETKLEVLTNDEVEEELNRRAVILIYEK